MDARMEVLARPLPGVRVDTEHDDSGTTTITLRWGDAAELRATQYREDDAIHVHLHGCGCGWGWASPAEVELYLEALASHPTRRWQTRFSTKVGFSDIDGELGSRLALRCRLPDAEFPLLPGLGSDAQWFTLFDDGWLVASHTAHRAVMVAGAPEQHSAEASVFSTDGRTLTMHDGYEGYDGILAVDHLPMVRVHELLRTASNPAPRGLSDHELMAWHLEHSRSPVRTVWNGARR